MRYYIGRKNFVYVNLMITAMKAAIKSNKKSVVVRVNSFSLKILKKLYSDGIIRGFNCLASAHLSISDSRLGLKKLSIFQAKSRKLNTAGTGLYNSMYLVYLPNFSGLRNLIMSFSCFVTASKLLMVPSAYITAKQFRGLTLKNANYVLISTNYGLLSTYDLLNLSVGGLVVLTGF